MTCTLLGTVDKLIEKIIGKVINYWKNSVKKVNVLHVYALRARNSRRLKSLSDRLN